MKTPRNFRMRQRKKDGSLRAWWEPRAEDRKLGFTTVELDADRMQWSVAEAEKLNAAVRKAQQTGAAIKPAGRGRTISDLISAYSQGIHFSSTLKPKTRDSYRKLMLVINAKWGTRRASEFDKPTMHAWYEVLYKTRGARMAQATMRMMSILMAHAEKLGWRQDNSNPCLRLQLKTPAPRSRWASPEEITALLDACDRLGFAGVRLAILLSLLHGQRQTDVLAATRDAFRLAKWQAPGDDQPRMRLCWFFVRSKRSNAGAMVLHDQALPWVRAAIADTGTAASPLGPSDVLIRDEVTGNPYSTFLFNTRWRAVIAAAADPKWGNCRSIQDLQFRDLRRTFAVLARQAVVSKADIGDVLGNSAAVNPLLSETYMPATFETASRAVQSIKLATKEKGQK